MAKAITGCPLGKKMNGHTEAATKPARKKSKKSTRVPSVAAVVTLITVPVEGEEVDLGVRPSLKGRNLWR